MAMIINTLFDVPHKIVEAWYQHRHINLVSQWNNQDAAHLHWIEDMDK